jgi:hypothetical protein
MPLDDVPAEESAYDAPSAEDDLLDPAEQIEQADFEDEIPASFGPYDPSSQPPTFGTPPKVEASPGDPVPEGTTTPPPDPIGFDPRWKEEFEGLLYIGALTSTFDYLGHRFIIRTLTQDEILEVTLAIKGYSDTEAYTKAEMMGVVAACVVSVDGRPLPHPITLDPGDTPFQNRWRYIRATWYPPVIDLVFNQYVRLEYKVREVMNSMGNLSG